MILILFYFKETQAIKALSDANIENILISPTAATDETSKDHLNELFFISTSPNTVQHIVGGMKLDGMLLSFGTQNEDSCLCIFQKRSGKATGSCMLGSGAISVPLPPFSLSLLLICHTNIYIYVSRCLLLGRVGVE
jgi:carbamoylphosphate synthase large subunit